ncbi:MAG: iron-sulfur cluster assembly protein [Chthoniobacterales bacterium]
MNAHQEIILNRDCDAIQIPSGNILVLPAGTQVMVTQSLGGTYTVTTPGGLARIDEKDADALGLEKTTALTAPIKTIPTGSLEEAVWDQLKTVFDPEIPVNVVDLGLIYDCAIIEEDENNLLSESSSPSEVQEVSGAQKLSELEFSKKIKKAHVKMTLTAPGCGMGPTIAADARNKILTIDGIEEAEVELVWDPAWNQSMISEAGRMKLGMI